MRLFTALPLLVILLLPFSCRKQTDSSYELIGKWHSCGDVFRNITIRDDGTGGYGGWDPLCDKKVKADENSFRIGGKRFDILVHPIPFDSASDWTGCVRTAFAPGNLPLKKMQIKSGKVTVWYYLRRQ